MNKYLIATAFLLACGPASDETKDDSSSDETDVLDTDVDTDDEGQDTDSDTDGETDEPVVDLADGLNFRSHFDGNTTDISPAGLTLLGNPPTYVADRHGTASAAVEAEHCLRYSSMTFDGSIGEFSFAAWIHPVANFAQSTRQTLSGGGGGHFQFYVSDATTTTEVYELIGENRRATSMRTETPYPADTWTHVAFVFDVTNGGQYYINGAEVTTEGTNWATVIQTGTGQLYVGCNALGEEFAADFDEVGMWSRRLNAAEVAALAAE